MKLLKHAGSERGAAFVIIAVFVVAIFAFAGLSIDVGNTLLQRKKVHEGCDAAALAAVLDWASGKTSAESKAMGTAYCGANGVKTNEITSIETGSWDHGTKTFTPSATLTAGVVPAVRVRGTRQVPLHFARIVGASQMNPKVESVAVAAKAIAANGAIPWAACDTFTPTKCTPITLQYKSGGETNACSDSGPLQGNFGQIEFPGRNGSKDYEEDIINGYQGRLTTGCATGTQSNPGVSWGPTKKGVDGRIDGLPAYNCTTDSPPPPNKRQAIVPKVATLDVKGKKYICITGFLVVSLEGYNNGAKTVEATVIESFAGSEIDPSSPPVPGELAGIGLVK